MDYDTANYRSKPASSTASSYYPSHPLERAFEAFNRFHEAFQNFSESLGAPESQIYNTSNLQKPIWSQRPYYDRSYYPTERPFYDAPQISHSYWNNYRPPHPYYDRLYYERPYHYFDDYHYHRPIYADEPIYQKLPTAKIASAQQQAERVPPQANKRVIIATERPLHDISISHPHVKISEQNPKNTQIESERHLHHQNSSSNHDNDSNKIPLSLVPEILPHIISDTIFEDGWGSRHHVTFDRAHKLLDEMLTKGKPDINLKKDDDLFNIGDDFDVILVNFGQKPGTAVSGTSYQTSNITKDGKTVTVSRESKFNPDGTVSTEVTQQFDDGKGQTDSKSRKTKFIVKPTANTKKVENQNLNQQQNQGQQQQNPNQKSQNDEKKIPEVEKIENLFQEAENNSIAQASAQQDQKIEVPTTSSQK